MNRPYKRRKRNKNGRLLFTLLVPMLLITLSSFGYAVYQGNVTTIATFTNGTEDISITDCTVISYNGFTIPPKLDWNDTHITFEDDLLYPGWELKLLTEITNTGTVRVKLSTQIYYSWNGITWTPTDANGLLTQFRINYTNGFYNDTGPDGEWFTDDDVEWNGRDGLLRLWPDPPSNLVYKEERLLFDAQDFQEELQDKTFYIKIDISATTS